MAVDASAPVIRAEGVTIVYPRNGADVAAVRGFDLAIAPGEMVGLIGETACGKSTAVLSLLGMVRPPGRRIAGRVMFDGRDLFALDPESQRRILGRDIGMIVQNPRMALSPLHSVGRQISNVYRAHNAVDPVAAKSHAIAMLKLVGINDPERRYDAYPHEISGGMAQRVLIAMALSSKPRLLVADEPTSGLDVTIQAQFLDAMWRATRQTASAVLLVTQDLGVIANYCDRVVVMQDGAIVEAASAAQFFADPQHAYSRAVLALQRDRRAPAQPAARPAKGPPLLAIRDLVKTFAVRGSKKRVHAVGGVSFEVAKGETLGIVGESGSGKTTVGRCLLRLEEPDSGEIEFDGEPISRIGQDRLRPYRAKLQIVFQDPYDQLNPRWRAREVLGEPLDLHFDLSKGEREARIRELLDLVELPGELLDRRPKSLSAGYQQRLSIARALATGPDLIVLDEPTSALAPAARASFIRLLGDLQARLGLSYIFISHDLNTVKHLCRNVAVMYLGQIVEYGTLEQVFGSPKHPYSRALLAAHLFPDPRDRRVDRPKTDELAGEIPSPIDLPAGCYLAGRCPNELPARCAREPQSLSAVGNGRSVRCWRAREPDETSKEMRA